MNRIDSLLTPFIRELRLEDSVRLAEIKKNWHSLFGKSLSCHMSPFMLSGSEILLNVDSHVWLQELNFYKEEITKKLNPYGVKEVRLRLGKVSTKMLTKDKPQRAKTLTADDLSFVEQVTSQMTDDELRETIQRAIRGALTSGWTKK